MIIPPIIELIIQKSGGDCAVAALAMMLGVSYADINAAVPHRRNAKQKGLSERQIISVGKRLGVSIGARVAPPEDDEFGMLDLRGGEGGVNKKQEGHVVLHFTGGNVYDPADGLLYTDVAAFLLAKDWQIQGFYWAKGQEG